jgi:hypothetical protein
VLTEKVALAMCLIWVFLSAHLAIDGSHHRPFGRVSSHLGLSLPVSRPEFHRFLDQRVQIHGDSGGRPEMLLDSQYRTTWAAIKSVRLTVSSSLFADCRGQMGGAIDGHRINTTIIGSVFLSNSAENGGAVRILLSDCIQLVRVLFLNNSAEYCGGFHGDGALHRNQSYVELVNSSCNSATKWIGAMRIDHLGGKMVDSCFAGNSAAVCGAFFEYVWRPATRLELHCVYRNNSAYSRGGAVTIFHIKHQSEFERCLFFQNRCDVSPHSISIESLDAVVRVGDCWFEGEQQDEVRLRFEQSALDVSGSRFGFANPETVYADFPTLDLTQILELKDT